MQGQVSWYTWKRQVRTGQRWGDASDELNKNTSTLSSWESLYTSCVTGRLLYHNHLCELGHLINPELSCYNNWGDCQTHSQFSGNEHPNNVNETLLLSSINHSQKWKFNVYQNIHWFEMFYKPDYKIQHVHITFYFLHHFELLPCALIKKKMRIKNDKLWSTNIKMMSQSMT